MIIFVFMENNPAPTIPTDSLSITERKELLLTFRQFKSRIANTFSPEETRKLSDILASALRSGIKAHDDKGLGTAIQTIRTADLFAEAIEPDRNILLSILLHPIYAASNLDDATLSRQWGDDVVSLLRGLETVGRFSNRNSVADQDNFRGLLLSLAEDIRVIIIMIVRNLVLMRSINRHPDGQWVRNVAFEANCLYAQLAHRLGLYKIKGELEDLSLKYTNREIYTQIARKLNETKRSRDAYIESFIRPVKEKLEAAGLKFDIKGRTKSISSIWAKMRKQKVDLDRIYDLFAIRVILDSEPAKEKSDCWLAYSILADMYTPNPARMRDWISIPKSNGYESLHATVLGPGEKWVEVQFRTRRMDLVAEKGLAAHWRYKGGKGDSTDQWMNNVRDILETAESGPMQLMKDLRMDIYSREVFVFTPKGDLFRLPAGATVLDFAFHIHSNIGVHCAGAIVNGTHRKINYRIESGDTVEIVTSASQSPKADWLNYAVSPKSRNKIKQHLNEEKLRKAELGKEQLMRRAKNRKVEIDEATLAKMIKKEGYRYANDFFADIASGPLDAGKVISRYLSFTAPEKDSEPTSAEGFVVRENPEMKQSEVLVIGEKAINGLSYRFARCCNPIYGDEVFGFISADGIVKIHKSTCPNAPNIRQRYPYRLIRVNWSSNTGTMLPASIRIVGTDDIGIVATITSIISKEPGVQLRNISVNSHDGLFQGFLTLGISDRQSLSSIIRKIKTVKGVKDVTR